VLKGVELSPPFLGARLSAEARLRAKADAAKQSILASRGWMDGFAETVIGRRFAPTRWLAMTVLATTFF
jgi:hypothetical protein